MRLETLPFDAAPMLDEEGRAELIADALASGKGAYIRHALAIAARSRGMAEIAHASGVSRAALDEDLSPEGDPKLSTLLGILQALGIKLSVQQNRG